MYYENKNIYLLLERAIFLDPRFKNNESNLNLIENELKEEMLSKKEKMDRLSF